MSQKAEALTKRLVIKAYHVEQVKFASETKFEGGILFVEHENLPLSRELVTLLSRLEVDILKPGQLHREVPSILDVVPIACKVLGRLGEGITHTLTGVSAVLTLADAGEKPPIQIGSSAGFLNEKMLTDRPGTPSGRDFIILIRLTLKEGVTFSRKGIMAAHQAADNYLQKIRNQLKKMDGKAYTEKHVFEEPLDPGKKEVLLIKLLPGQGTMHDFFVLPNEPCGVEGSRSIIDLGNMPVFLTPNEYRDGALRALT